MQLNLDGLLGHDTEPLLMVLIMSLFLLLSVRLVEGKSDISRPGQVELKP